jgi:hypothetical protein
VYADRSGSRKLLSIHHDSPLFTTLEENALFVKEKMCFFEKNYDREIT